jgi:hypothetical protein
VQRGSGSGSEARGGAAASIEAAAGQRLREQRELEAAVSPQREAGATGVGAELEAAYAAENAAKSAIEQELDAMLAAELGVEVYGEQIEDEVDGELLRRMEEMDSFVMPPRELESPTRRILHARPVAPSEKENIEVANVVVADAVAMPEPVPEPVPEYAYEYEYAYDEVEVVVEPEVVALAEPAPLVVEPAVDEEEEEESADESSDVDDDFALSDLGLEEEEAAMASASWP